MPLLNRNILSFGGFSPPKILEILIWMLYVFILILVTSLVASLRLTVVAVCKTFSSSKDRGLLTRKQKNEDENENELDASKSEKYNVLVDDLIGYLSSRNGNLSNDSMQRLRRNDRNDGGHTMLSANEISRPEESLWLNVLILRYWMLLFRSHSFITELKSHWTELINKKTGPSSIISNISISDIDIGSGVPHVSEISIVKNVDRQLSVTLEGNLNYGGGLSLSIDAVAFGNYKLEGRVNVPEFCAKVRVCCPSPDSPTQAAFAFVKYPKLDLSVNLSVPSHINRDIIRRAISKILSYVLRRAFMEFLVLPNWYSIKLPLLSGIPSSPSSEDLELGLGNSVSQDLLPKKAREHCQYKGANRPAKSKPIAIRDTCSSVRLKSQVPPQEDVLQHINILIDSDLNAEGEYLEVIEDKILSSVFGLIKLKSLDDNCIAVGNVESVDHVNRTEPNRLQDDLCTSGDILVSWRSMRRKYSIIIQKLKNYENWSIAPRIFRSVFIVRYSTSNVLEILSDIEHNLFINECCKVGSTVKQFDSRRSLVKVKYRNHSRKGEKDIELHLIQVKSEVKVNPSNLLSLIKRASSDVVAISDEDPSYMILYRSIGYKSGQTKIGCPISNANSETPLESEESSSSKITPDAVKPCSRVASDKPTSPDRAALPSYCEDHPNAAVTSILVNDQDQQRTQRVYIKAYYIIPVVISSPSMEYKGSCLMEISSYSRDLEFLNLNLYTQKQLRDYINSKCSVFDFAAKMLNYEVSGMQRTGTVSSIEGGQLPQMNNNFSDVLDLYSSIGDTDTEKPKMYKDASVASNPLHKISKKLINKIKPLQLLRMNVPKVSHKFRNSGPKDSTSPPISGKFKHVPFRRSSNARSQPQRCDVNSDSSTAANQFSESAGNLLIGMASPTAVKDFETIPEISGDGRLGVNTFPGLYSIEQSEHPVDFFAGQNSPESWVEMDPDGASDEGNRHGVSARRCLRKYFTMNEVSENLEMLDVDIPLQNELEEIFVVWEACCPCKHVSAMSAYFVCNNVQDDDEINAKNRKRKCSADTTLLFSQTPIYSSSLRCPSMKGSALLSLGYNKINKIVFLRTSPRKIQDSTGTVIICWIYGDILSMPSLSAIDPLIHCGISAPKTLWDINISMVPESSVDIFLLIKKPEYAERVILFTQSTSPLLLFSAKLLDSEEGYLVHSMSPRQKKLSLLAGGGVPDPGKYSDIRGMFKSAKLYAKKKFEKGRPRKMDLRNISDPNIFPNTRSPDIQTDSVSPSKVLSGKPSKILFRRRSSPTGDAVASRPAPPCEVRHSGSALPRGYTTDPRPALHTRAPLHPIHSHHSANISEEGSKHLDGESEVYKENTPDSAEPDTPINGIETSSVRGTSLDYLLQGVYDSHPPQRLSSVETLSNDRIPVQNGDDNNTALAGNHSTHEILFDCTEGYLKITVDNLVSQYRHEANLKVCILGP